MINLKHKETNNKVRKNLILSSLLAGSLLMLTACSGGGNNNVATFKGGSVTSQDVYNMVKFNTQVQNSTRNLVIFKIYGEKYGNKITTEQINKAYKAYKSNYDTATAFKSFLKSSGYTTETFKDVIKNQLAFEYGVKSNMKVSESDLKSEWDKYQADQKIKIIVASSEDDINSAKTMLNEGTDFDTVAKDKSLVKTTDYTMTYNDSTIPDTIKNTVYSMSNNDVSDIITYEDSTTSSKLYYIVKLVKKSNKPDSMSKVKTQLESNIKSTWFNDSSKVNSIVKKELSSVNFKLNDDTYKSVFSDIIISSTD